MVYQLWHGRSWLLKSEGIEIFIKMFNVIKIKGHFPK